MSDDCDYEVEVECSDSFEADADEVVDTSHVASVDCSDCFEEAEPSVEISSESLEDEQIEEERVEEDEEDKLEARMVVKGYYMPQSTLPRDMHVIAQAKAVEHAPHSCKAYGVPALEPTSTVVGISKGGVDYRQGLNNDTTKQVKA